MIDRILLYDDLVIEAIQQRAYNCLSVYTALRFLYPHGNPRIDELDFEKIKKMTGYKDLRSIKTAISALIKLRWVKINNKVKRIYLMSQESIKKIKGWKTILLIEMKSKYCSKDRIKAFAGATLFAKFFRRYHVNFKYKNKRVVSVNDLDYDNLFKGMYSFHAPIAITGIEKLSSIPKSTVDRLKKTAMKKNLLEVKEDYTTIGKKHEFHGLRSMHPEYYKLYTKNGCTVIREVDLIKPRINFKKRNYRKRLK